MSYHCQVSRRALPRKSRNECDLSVLGCGGDAKKCTETKSVLMSFSCHICIVIKNRCILQGETEFICLENRANQYTFFSTHLISFIQVQRRQVVFNSGRGGMCRTLRQDVPSSLTFSNHTLFCATPFFRRLREKVIMATHVPTYPQKRRLR